MAFADCAPRKGEVGGATAGVFLVKGMEYLVADGDLMHFRGNI